MRSSHRPALLAASCVVVLSLVSEVGHATVLAAGAGGWKHLLDIGSWWSAEHTYSARGSRPAGARSWTTADSCAIWEWPAPWTGFSGRRWHVMRSIEARVPRRNVS